MARALFDIERPTVGLLNVGVEEIKGQEEVKEAGRMLREAGMASMNYHGFVEGDDIGKGTVDVVVTEGFAGNIALKTAEGTARQIADYLRAAMSRTLMAQDRLCLRQGRLRPAAREDGCAQVQWRRVPRAERHRREKPWRHRRRRVSRPRSNLATTWSATGCLTASRPTSTCSMRAIRIARQQKSDVADDDKE